MNDKTIEKRAGFTRGPWKVAGYNYIRGTIFSVAVAIDLPGQDEKEKQANARLIANSPAMYDMLVKISQGNGYDTLTLAMEARELLAKVDGGEV
tara:strand:+ start:1311 stop:1592 length:282 start_codon:yes stop_codon:yes gene_type:complete